MKKTGVNKTNRWQRVLISAAIMISAIGPFAAVAQNLWLITFDIGHANSELFVVPDGKTMLFDTGTETACRDKIIPFLQYHGINQINYVIRSHEHADHVGG
ncbi:MAG: MBL fold metallo-hydrolase, partial [Pontiellaceae bacterium]|nr:MBL fold metallo-hydrolase [Pontiellaceae bacterium]